MKDLSLLLPTRKRVKQVSTLFDSIKATTSHPENIEVIMYMDDDDTESHKISCKDFSIVKLVEPRGETMGKINRTCYRASSGRYIMLLNDDVIFRTPQWDTAVLSIFSRFKDDIALVYGNDLFQQEKMASFPILSRIACDLMGGVCPSEYRRVFIDVHIFDIFKKLQNLGYDRIIYLKDVIFEHMSYDVGKATHDANYAGRSADADLPVLIMGEDRREIIVSRIVKYIMNPTPQ